MLQSSQDARPEAGENARAEERIYAALDLGTNNCRLLIAALDRQSGHALRVFDSFSRVVRLGEGVSATGQLSADAMERTLAALRACEKKLSRYALAGSRFVATEACRRASNGRAFLDRVQRETGLDIGIISSEEEARLAFMGCSSLLTEASRRAIVFDIGGGSTEMMWVDVDRLPEGGRHAISDWLSIGFGVMNLADKFGGSNFADVTFNDMVKLLLEKITPFDRANRISETAGDTPVHLLSTSGTVTTLAAVHLNLPRYDRARIDGLTLNVSDIRNTIRRLLAMRPSERFNHPCIGPDRADFILSGCAIFEAVSSLYPEGRITIADRGVREGIILSLMNRK
ncbi:MAG: Ppx/GppA family phosphatase [Pseudomonadota bacterium]|nr:Ppx/GppA family phosphatase [Pseudomonadota bacterium]